MPIPPEHSAVPPKRSAVLLALFRLYLHWFFWRRFNAVRVLRADMPHSFAGRPLVVYCNHPSWWDPALILLALPKFFAGRRGYGPMDAAELRRYGLFRTMGVFGVDAASSGKAAEFLRTAKAILLLPDSCLCVTAEGSFADPRPRPIRLRRGLAHLARLCPDAVFIPLALEYSFWNESKPEALLAFGSAVALPPGCTSAQAHACFEAALTRTMDRLSHASATRSAEPFRLVMSGTAGVGGIYDLWRRLHAAAGGRTLDARHQPGPPS